MELAKVVHKILTAGSLGSIVLFVLGLSLTMLPALQGQEKPSSGISVNLGGCKVSGFSLLSLAGTVILLATPLTVNVASSILYLSRREYKFAVITSLVALVMVSSLILGVLGFFCPKT
ncbi:DUF1634 domain-containing protein [Candidatus Bathyarchaeota archaeon]|nr:DUF1634 domain-containing protein [Candidatus Bathyarchaeota archaeon]